MSFVAAATIGSALIGSNASDNAADAASDAANNANALEKAMYDQTRQDNLPYQQTGYAANDLINMLLGVPPTSGAATSQSLTPPTLSDYNALRAQLLPQYTSQQVMGMGDGVYQDTVVDEAGLKKAIEAQMAKEQQAYQQYQSQQAAAKAGQPVPGSTNPLFGLLTKDYTPQNMLSDPGYQFRQDEMAKAVERSAAARGGLYSGATAKALQDRSANVAAQGYNDDWNRFQQGRANIINPLLAISGRGQTAIGQVSSAGQNYAGAAGNNMMGAANMQGAAGMNSGVIWGNALNQLGSMAGRSKWANPIQPGGGWGTGDAYGNEDLGMYYSDERLKKNKRPIGRTARGNTIYAWDWKTGGSGRGVIAQEVAHIPGAVHDDADGILMVDYSKV